MNVCSVVVQLCLNCSVADLTAKHVFRFDCCRVMGGRAGQERGGVGGGEVLAEAVNANETGLFL